MGNGIGRGFGVMRKYRCSLYGERGLVQSVE